MAQTTQRLLNRRVLPLALLAGVVVALAAVLAGGSQLQGQGASLTLREPWNLVAAPRDATPQQLVGNIAAVQSIHLWNSDTRRFESWRRSAPDFANTLDFVPIGAGLWVQVSDPVAWSLPPLSAVHADQDAAGFQLLGWTDVDTAAADALRDFAGDAIFGWDEFRQRFVSFFPELPGPLNSLSLVERGRAYWVVFGDELPPVALELAFQANSPVDLIPFLGADVLVVEKDGLLRRFNTLTGQSGPTLLDLRAEVATGGERGLLSVALDPLFSQNGLVYAYYWVAGQNRTRIERFTTFNGSLVQGSEIIILEIGQPFGNHNGGRLLFGPDGLLYLGLGDGGSQRDPDGNGQNLGTLLGSIIRIDVSNSSIQTPYVVPPDNPFVNRAGARPEIYAYGFRNPWRMSFDPDTGLLWVGDVGQNRIEEIDIVEAGGNYGWNTLEGDECLNSPCSAAGTVLPVATYTHDQGCSVTGGVVYRGGAYEQLIGVYLFADFCAGDILGTRAASPGSIDELALDVGDIVSFGLDGAGEVYVVTLSGRIFKIVEP